MAWEPSTGSDLEIWLKSDIGITKDGSDLVSTWADQSGNGNDATAIGTSRPLFVASQLNGIASILFDGGNDFMTFGDILDTVLQGTSAKFSLYIVAKMNAINSVQTFLSKESDGSNNSGFIWFVNDISSTNRVGTLIRNGDRTLSFRERSTADVGTTNAFSTAWVHDATESTPVDRMTMYIDSITAASVTTVANDETSFTANDHDLLLGAHKNFANGDSFNIDGPIFEIFIFSHTSDAAEINNAFTYIKDRYALDGILVTATGCFQSGSKTICPILNNTLSTIRQEVLR